MDKKQLVYGLVGCALLLAGAGCKGKETVTLDYAGKPPVEVTSDMPVAENDKGVVIPGSEINKPNLVVPTDGAYEVDTQASSVQWKADKAVGAGQSGTVGIRSGGITIKNGAVSAGKFVIDLRTIRDDKGSAQLEEHLKNADFFDVEKYPEAKFVITEVYSNDVRAIAPPTRYMVKGDLTIKGKTMAIEFPAEIVEANGVFSATATLTIDRTKWGITYGSGTVFKNLGDKLIKDEIVFNLNLKTVAKK